MLANYGYKDGSGEYFITIDTLKCDGCGACVTACDKGVFEVGEDQNDPFREQPVALVVDGCRKKINYLCIPCKEGAKRTVLPCTAACKAGAIMHSW